MHAKPPVSFEIILSLLSHAVKHTYVNTPTASKIAVSLPSCTSTNNVAIVDSNDLLQD